MADINSPQDNLRESRILMTSLLVVIIAAIALGIVGFFLLSKPKDYLEGQADATTVRVSGKLPGRVYEIYVSEGDTVQRGDTLIHIHSSLAEARLSQAEAMDRAARAMDSKVDAGTRPQLIAAAQDMVRQAEAATEITRKTYERLDALAQKGVVSRQKRDEAKAAYDAARAAESAAREQLSLAKAGAQRQDKESAQAMVDVAQGSVAEVNAVLEDQYLTAPADGIVDVVYPEPGELVALGTPLMSILKTDDKWVTFNVREEQLASMKLGDELTVKLPAYDMREIRVKVYYIRDLGTYATWRATKATGQWDSRTFEVKARPVEPQPDMRPGMTVLLDK